MSRNVLSKTLWDQRRAMLWWSLGVLFVIAIYVLPYEQYTSQGLTDLNTDTPMYEALGIGDMSTAAGYLEGSVFGMLMPLLFIMAATIAGARAVAGDEETGLLDLLLARPVGRSRLVVERFVALVIEFAWFGVLSWAAITLAAAPAGIDVTSGRIAAAVLGLTLLGVTFGAVALAVGAAFGRRALALAITAALAVAALLVNNLAPQIDGLDWLQRLSPFYYYIGGSPLHDGLIVGHALVLAAIPLALLAVALWSFSRRDVAV